MTVIKFYQKKLSSLQKKRITKEMFKCMFTVQFKHLSGKYRNALSKHVEKHKKMF